MIAKSTIQDIITPGDNSGNSSPLRVSSFVEQLRDKMGTKYKKPKIHPFELIAKLKKKIEQHPGQAEAINKRIEKCLAGKWFVYYSYRNPNSGRFQRFKVYEQINEERTIQYAELLKDAVALALKEGLNPFKDIEVIGQKQWTAQQALLYFLQTWGDRELDEDTFKRYDYVVRLFLTWLKTSGLDKTDINNIERKHIEMWLLHEKTAKNWGNRAYNNNKGYLTTCFIFLEDAKIIISNPCKKIKRKKTLAKKHRAYNKPTFERIQFLLKQKDPYLYFATQIIYYLCIRSEEELKHLKIKHVDRERMQVMVAAENSKLDADRMIPLCREMLEIFEHRGVFNYNPEYYLLGIKNQPRPKPFGHKYFSTRFGVIRDADGLDQAYSIYGFKHTRVIHLKLDGANDAEIMSLTGHESFQAYSAYLRDLGMDVDPERINEFSRKY